MPAKIEDVREFYDVWKTDSKVMTLNDLLEMRESGELRLVKDHTFIHSKEGLIEVGSRLFEATICFRLPPLIMTSCRDEDGEEYKTLVVGEGLLLAFMGMVGRNNLFDSPVPYEHSDDVPKLNTALYGKTIYEMPDSVRWGFMDHEVVVLEVAQNHVDFLIYDRISSI